MSLVAGQEPFGSTDLVLPTGTSLEQWRGQLEPDDPTHLDVGLVRPLPAVLTGLLTLVAIASTGRVRELEAALSAAIAPLLGIDEVRHVGSTVLFQVDGQLTGYTLTAGCSVVFLLLPFMLVTTVLMGVRRVPVWQAAAALASAVAVLVVTNQVRIATVAVAMDQLGALRGYSLTHVMVGSVLSTLGAVVAGVVYLLVLLAGSDRRVRLARGAVRRG